MREHAVGRGHDIRLGAGHGGRAAGGRPDGVVERVVLTAQQRLAVERAVGIGVRWAVGASCDLLRGNVVAELHAVTRDGVVLGTVLAAAEMDGWRQYRTLAEIYRDAGADEHVAQPRPRFARLTGSRDQSSTGKHGYGRRGDAATAAPSTRTG